MKNIKYNRIADLHKVKNNKMKDYLMSFLSGGFIGMMGEIIIEIYTLFFHISRSGASTYMILTFIFLGSLFTALGFFDKLVSKFKCGLLIPITGFANSMTSAAIEYKNEGPIYGIGSNIFKLSGSVILYGIVAAWFFGMIRYLLEVYL